MKNIVKLSCLLFLIFFFSCETKTSKKEDAGYCGTMDLPENKAYLNVPDVVSENCFSCHDINNKVVGSSFKEISKRSLSKAEVISFLKEPSDFNAKSEVLHTSFEMLDDDEFSTIYSWLDSLKYN